MAQIEAGILDPLHHLDEHGQPRSGTVSLPHVAAGPAAKPVHDFTGAGPPERIGQTVAQAVE